MDSLTYVPVVGHVLAKCTTNAAEEKRRWNNANKGTAVTAVSVGAYCWCKDRKYDKKDEDDQRPKES